MQHNRPAPYPRPDVHPAWAQSRSPHPYTIRPTSQQEQPAPPSQSGPDFLIVGLFALRLARRLIYSLDPYPERTGDIEWLDNFLARYHTSYDLAKVTGATRDTYLQTYPQIVARMKAQRRYPFHFMILNPVTPQRREALSRRGGLTDSERLEIIDFADAAGEWGSVVHVPHGEAERMLKLADQRRVADLERRQDVEHGSVAMDQARTNVERHV